MRRTIYWLFWRWKHHICVFNDTNGVCFTDCITSITFQHIWKRRNVSMLYLREVWTCLCWVCLLLSLRLASVYRASRVGRSRGQRSVADELVTVAVRGWARGLFPGIFQRADGRLGPRGFRSDVSGRCCALLVLPWPLTRDAPPGPPSRGPWRQACVMDEARNSLIQLWEQHVFSFEHKGEWKWLSLSFPWQFFVGKAFYKN